ncbi:hypothetical protein GIB67_012078 [Kingdonia uniflora]|uniref:XS domain-containing protein n=1 Tax=Kingdonia uniflora TaxID=39325 RepID=A0A7J7LI55_9MAGN|nr:hypothetical protein GIB67_012078 [Kingdonia uniflora]
MLNCMLFNVHGANNIYRDSKEFPDMHILVMHAFNCPDSRVEHLGLHKALCVLMGWSYAKVPDHSKGYRSLSAEEAAVNKEDLIMWPPIVIIHNTSIGRGKDGRMEGMGNKMMDNKLKGISYSFIIYFIAAVSGVGKFPQEGGSIDSYYRL